MTRTLYLTVLALTALTPVAPARAELPAGCASMTTASDRPGEFGFEIPRQSHPEPPPAPGSPGTNFPLPGPAPDAGNLLRYQSDHRSQRSLPTLVDGRGVRYLGGQQLQLSGCPSRPRRGRLVRGESISNWSPRRGTSTPSATASKSAHRRLPGSGVGGHRQSADQLRPHPRQPGRRLRSESGIRVSRAVGDGVHAGVELYTELGKLADPAPRREQAHTAYLTVDVVRSRLETQFRRRPRSDRRSGPWVLKAIVGSRR